MTSFVLPHEVSGDGAYEVSAVHGRSARAAVPPDPDRTALTRADGGEPA